jgi:hypothetical protein
MENDQIVARIVSLEALIVGTMGLLFAMSSNDAEMFKQKAVLNLLQKEFESGLDHLPQSIQKEAKAHMSDVLDRVILRTNQLRGDRKPN